MANSLTIIHGDDTTKSRNYFIDLKTKIPNSQTFDGNEIDPTSLTQIVEGGSLFSDEKNIFIENLLVKKKNSAEYKLIYEILTSTYESLNLVLWEGKEIDKGILTSFKNANVKIFKHPSVLFSFLDSIKPDNSKILLQFFYETLKTMDEEVVFYMLVRHFRLMIAITEASNTTDDTHMKISDTKSEISELKRLAPWQNAKLKKQATLFSITALLKHYNRLFEIESASKTGNLPHSLRTSIDIFLTGL